MQEPEFEKKVRVKMDELKFSPSDAVWANVQLQIKRDRERRRPIFWFFLSGVCLLLGLFVFEMMHLAATKDNKLSSTPKAIVTSKDIKLQEADKNQEIKNNVPSIKEARTRDALIHQANEERRIEVVGKQNKKKISDRPETSQLIDEAIQNDDKFDKASKKQDTRQESAIDAIAEAHLSTIASQESNPVSGETDRNVIKTNPVSPAMSPVNGQTQPSSKPNPEAAELAKDKLVQTQKIGSNHPWKFGLLMGPGISNIQSGLISTQYASASPNPPSYAFGGNPPPVVAPAYYQGNSSAHSGFSFLAGASLQKYLSQNVYFSTGMNYHYYSTATSFSSGSTLLSSGNTGNNSTYTDAFHFIELPANFGFHLSNKKKSPLIAELGLTLSQLIHANAHQYDVYTGYYTVNSSAFSHTQVFANLGLLLNLPVKKNQLTIGPVMQYGLTNLLSSGSVNPEHLFFLGFRFGISLNK
ncbi:MAG: outer membrane beta-barrel protein [Chitinophagales bacterium]